MPRVSKQTHLAEVTTTEYTREDLQTLLGLPADAEIFVHVPGGGDWSNMDLDIDEHSFLSVRVRTEKHSEE